MSILFAMFYGLIQGLTEFLPVSSSAHLAILQNQFGLGLDLADPIAFDVLLHLGTLLAVFIVYHRDIGSAAAGAVSLIARPFRRSRRTAAMNDGERMALLLLLATLPMAGALLIDGALDAIYQSTRLIGGVLIANGMFLLLSDRMARGVRTLPEARPRHALAVGFGQLCAVIPGLSRSGTTVTCGLFCGFSRPFAVKFSFLLSIPAILGANITKLPALLEARMGSVDLLACGAGALTALVCGILAMKLLTYVSKKEKFSPFGWYCIIVGLCAVLLG